MITISNYNYNLSAFTFKNHNNKTTNKEFLTELNNAYCIGF
jgi:hypothetical protein